MLVSPSPSCLELLSSVLIHRPIIVQDVNKLKIVALSDLVVFVTVRWCNFDSAGTEFHVNSNVIRNDGHATAGDEGMHSEFAMQVLRS